MGILLPRTKQKHWKFMIDKNEGSNLTYWFETTWNRNRKYLYNMYDMTKIDNKLDVCPWFKKCLLFFLRAVIVSEYMRLWRLRTFRKMLKWKICWRWNKTIKQQATMENSFVFWYSENARNISRTSHSVFQKIVLVPVSTFAYLSS